MNLFRRACRRTEVCPPSALTFNDLEDSRWGRLTRWLRRGAHRELPQCVRQAFDGALEGIGGAEAEELRTRVRRASGLRELWHLRSAVFGLVAQQGSELEAQRRMAAVDRHFPTRQRATVLGPGRRA